jgi:hypothetical protein
MPARAWVRKREMHTAQILIERALIRILESAASADIVHKHFAEIGTSRDNVRD